MYTKNPNKTTNGGFRARASFPITPEMIIRINAICLARGFTFAKSCQEAMELYASEFEKEKLPLNQQFDEAA